MADVNDLLAHLLEQNGSDLHVKVGTVPHLRVQGRLRPTPFDPPTVDDLTALVADLVPTARTRDLAERGEVSIAHAVPGLGRFRLNVYRQRGSYGLAIRVIAPGAPALSSLGLPESVPGLVENDAGLVLVCGPASSGKTTTAAALLDHLNQLRAAHIVTLEDPIEVLLADRTSLISQREIGSDTRSAADALRRIDQLDPDVIYVSKLEDPDTIDQVLTAAGAGRLVIATTTAASAADALHRLVGHFEATRQPRIRHALATVLRGVVCQRLVEGVDGSGLVAAAEILTASPEVTEAVATEAGPNEFAMLMATGSDRGMQAMDQSLIALVRSGRVAPSVAIAASSDPDRLAAVVAEASNRSDDEKSATPK